jgi:uncharacterized phiE125 gp8 family phage protein
MNYLVERYALTQTIAPTIDPVSLAEQKAHCRVDHTDDDAYLLALITAATNTCESFTGRQFINATYTLKLDGFPATDEIELPKPPLSSVTSIAYIDTAGNSQTVAAADYQVDSSSYVGRIMPAYNAYWPATRDQQYNTVTVTFVAGYGTTAATVPIRLRQGIKVFAATMYEHREMVIVGTIKAEIPEVCRSLWYPFKLVQA